jgi:pectinesterase
MADKPIQTTDKHSSIAEPPLFERKYFWNCHREGGDYAWFAHNLDRADGSPREEQITASWTFDGRWDPERTSSPRVVGVDVQGDRIFVQFDESVAGAAEAQIERSDHSIAKYVDGNGSPRLVFAGGNAAFAPVRFVPGDNMYATTATVAPCMVGALQLPKVSKRAEITILLVGDSTVATYKPDDERQGWGGVLSRCFDDRVTIVNRARNGRSSKSFRADGLWDEAMKVKANYVLIQFGHNDNPGKGPERETNAARGGDFRENLRRYVREVQAKGAKPILVTPTSRRVYAKDGLIDRKDANVAYAEATRAVAAEMKIPLVDLNQLTRDLFDRMGEAPSNWIQPAGDRTHFTSRGARRIAAIAVESLQQTAPELKPFVVQESLTRD